MKAIILLLGVLLVAESRAAPISYDVLDDAAVAALMAIALRQNPRREHIGLLYETANGLERTPTQTTGAGRTHGTFAVSPSALRALFHNHPALVRRDANERDDDHAKFSKDDIWQARQLGVPSYLSADNRVMRYDPATRQTTEVLARIPIEEILKQIAQRRPAQNPIVAAEQSRGR